MRLLCFSSSSWCETWTCFSCPSGSLAGSHIPALCFVMLCSRAHLIIHGLAKLLPLGHSGHPLGTWNRTKHKLCPQSLVGSKSGRNGND